jgi:hypothetical protein
VHRILLVGTKAYFASIPIPIPIWMGNSKKVPGFHPHVDLKVRVTCGTGICHESIRLPYNRPGHKNTRKYFPGQSQDP